MASTTDESLDRKHFLVVGGASAGTVFEWYDFYLYGSLATYITRHFFSGVNETTGYIFALLAFAAGFAVSVISKIQGLPADDAMIAAKSMEAWLYATGIWSIGKNLVQLLREIIGRKDAAKQ